MAVKPKPKPVVKKAPPKKAAIAAKTGANERAKNAELTRKRSAVELAKEARLISNSKVKKAWKEAPKTGRAVATKKTLAARNEAAKKITAAYKR